MYEKNATFFGGVVRLVATNQYDFVDHGYVFCVTDKEEIIKFSCYLQDYDKENILTKGSIDFARIICCGDPDDNRSCYKRHFFYPEYPQCKIGLITDNDKLVSLGDSSGIVYGATGLCFQIANRILYASDGYPRLCPERSAKILYLIYGIYGNCYFPCEIKIFKKGSGSLSFLEYFAACELIYEKVIPPPTDYDYSPYMEKIKDRTEIIKTKLEKKAIKNKDFFLLNELKLLKNPVLLILGRFYLLCKDAGLDPFKIKDLKKFLLDFLEYMFKNPDYDSIKVSHKIEDDTNKIVLNINDEEFLFQDFIKNITIEFHKFLDKTKEILNDEEYEKLFGIKKNIKYYPKF